MLGQPLQFDFSGDPPEPDWLIDGLLERGTITVLSADSGAGKSLISASLITAIIQGVPWLGRDTHGSRAMVVDEENFSRIVQSRFHALGLGNEDRAKLRYFLRLGVSYGEDDWLDRTLAEMEIHKPDLLVIDTASAATAVDVNDNSSVVRLFRDILRPLATEGCAVLLLHHERKPATGGKRHAGHAMMGARQWAGQADAHLAIEALGPIREKAYGDGSSRKRFDLKLEVPKNRDGAGKHILISVVSDHPAEGRNYTMRVGFTPERGVAA